MTDYGHILNTIAFDPSVDVDLSILDLVNVVTLGTAQTSQTQDPETVNGNGGGVGGYNYVSTGYWEDSSGFKGFALLHDDHTFNVYKVNGSTSISLVSSTAISLPFSSVAGSLNQVLGIKRVSAALYYIYYANFTGPSTVFGRVDVVPGGASTDIVFATYTYPTFYTSSNSQKRIGETCYVAVCGLVTTTVNYVQGYIYSFDMNTEALSGGLVYQSPGTIYAVVARPTTNTSLDIKMGENNGSLVWAMVYMYATVPASFPYYWRVVLSDGSENDFATGISSFFDSWRCSLTLYQWNKQDSLLSAFLNRPFHVQYANIVSGVLKSPSYPAPTLAVYPFYSASIDLCIGRDSSSGTFYFMTPATGAIGSAVTIPGVSTIYTIFPILDIYSLDLYMIVKMTSDGSIKFVSVNSTTFDIDVVYDNVIVTYSGNQLSHPFNTGFFFTQNYFNTLHVFYLTNPVLPVQGSMIPEWF